jgi:hypothetical protein
VPVVVLDDAAGVEKAPLQGVGDGRVVAGQAASLRRLVFGHGLRLLGV